tara:strand:- start:2450 stop:3058 length:609 start_codon:yes stop_codon:yes gene_type:complete
VLLREDFLLVLLLVALRFAPPALRVLQPFFAAADLFAFVIRVDFLLGAAFLLVRRVVDFRERAALLAAFDLLVALALRVLQPFFAAADLFALDGPLLEVFLAGLREAFLLRDAAAFLPAADLLEAFLLRVAAAFLAALDLFAAFLLRVAAAFFAAALREAFVPPLLTGFRAFLLVVRLVAIDFTFLLFFGGFTNTSVPSLIE